MTMDQLEIP